MSKHAYLILAHTNIPQLAVLLSMLDYDQNDIFVHIDAKQKEYDKSMLQSAVKKSSLYLLDNPISVEWGQYSGIDLVKVLNIGGVGQKNDVGTFRNFLHHLDHKCQHHAELRGVEVADYITADDASIVLNHNGSTTSSLFMAIIT